MSVGDVIPLVTGFLQGFLSSSAFVLVLFIGFCVLLGFTKTKATSGNAKVVKSLDESLTRQAVHYFAPTDPRGPADQLKAPELVEAAARK
jgi:hypothetical protein